MVIVILGVRVSRCHGEPYHRSSEQIGVGAALEAWVEIDPQIERWLGWGIGLLIALGFGGFGLACIWTGLHGLLGDLRTWRLAWASRRWAAVTGAIITAQVRVIGAGRRVKYEPDVTYTYQAGGRRYTGTRLGFASWAHDRARDQVEATLRPYPPGATATVYYDPARPEVVTLERRLPRGQVAGCLLVSIMVGVGSGFVAIGWKALTELVQSVVGR